MEIFFGGMCCGGVFVVGMVFMFIFGVHIAKNH